MWVLSVVLLGPQDLCFCHRTFGIASQYSVQVHIAAYNPFLSCTRALIQGMDALLCPRVAEHNCDDAKVRFMLPPRH